MLFVICLAALRVVTGSLAGQPCYSQRRDPSGLKSESYTDPRPDQSLSGSPALDSSPGTNPSPTLEFHYKYTHTA